MRRTFVLCLTILMLITFSIGCGVSRESDPNQFSRVPPAPKILGGVPASVPTLDVIYTSDNAPQQRVQTAKLTSSWFVDYEDGTGLYSHADAFHPLSLDTDSYAEITIQVGGGSGVIELQFSDDYQPSSVSVQHWRAEHATGRRDITELLDKGELVEISNGSIHVTADGQDYIYEVYAQWPNGSSFYAFRTEGQ